MGVLILIIGGLFATLAINSL